MKRSILVVDDEKLLLWSLKKTFTKEGYDVYVAESAEQALEIIKNQNLDILITDIRLPGISGLELLMKIRNISPFTRVVVMTAYGSRETSKLAYSNGAYKYVDKPLDLNKMKRIVREVCQNFA